MVYPKSMETHRSGRGMSPWIKPAVTDSSISEQKPQKPVNAIGRMVGMMAADGAGTAGDVDASLALLPPNVTNSMTSYISNLTNTILRLKQQNDKLREATATAFHAATVTDANRARAPRPARPPRPSCSPVKVEREPKTSPIPAYVSQPPAGKSLKTPATKAEAKVRSDGERDGKESGARTPFCNACRMLVMDRMTMVLPFYPHPAIDDRMALLFEKKVKERYQQQEHRSRARKVSAEWCNHCRSGNGSARTTLDRFSLMWEDENVQCRVQTDWYKDVRRIDEALISIAENMQTEGGAVDVVALEKLDMLARHRRELKPVRKAQERFEKGTAGGPFYADRIIEAVNATALKGAHADCSMIFAAVFGFQKEAPEWTVASLEAAGAYPAPMTVLPALSSRAPTPPDAAFNNAAVPSEPAPTFAPLPSVFGGNHTQQELQMFKDTNDLLFGTNSGPSSLFQAGSGAFTSAATGAGANVAAGTFTPVPTQFDLRFTHVNNQPAHVNNAAQTSLVNVGVEVAISSLLESTAGDDFFFDGCMDFIGYTEGSIIVTFVCNLVQLKTSAAASTELAARVQQRLRSMTSDQIQAYMPGLTLDVEFTRVKQLTLSELDALVRQPRQVDALSVVATENASLQTALMNLARPLREQCDQLGAENRKYRRLRLEQEYVRTIIETSADDEDEFCGFSDSEDGDFWSAPPPKAKATREPPPIPEKTAEDIASVTAPLARVSLSVMKSNNKPHTNSNSIASLPKSIFRGNVPDTPLNHYAQVD